MDILTWSLAPQFDDPLFGSSPVFFGPFQYSKQRKCTQLLLRKAPAASKTGGAGGKKRVYVDSYYKFLSLRADDRQKERLQS